MWKSWKYKNLTILISSFLLSVALGSFLPFKIFIYTLGLTAAFLAGVIFISTFTTPIAAVTLLVLAPHYPLPLLWVIAGCGAIISDFLFFNLTKDGIADEVEPIYDGLAGNHFHRILKTKHFRWLFPVVGALIIFSPLPKAPGINLLGIPKLNHKQFVALSAAVSTAGIAFILLLSFFIKL